MKGVGGIFGKLRSEAGKVEKNETPLPARLESRLEKNGSDIDDSPVPLVTWRTVLLATIASMGGFIFGYSTGKRP